MRPRLCLVFLTIVVLAIVPRLVSAQLTDFWNIDFSKADSIASSYAGEDLKHIDILAEKLTADLHTEPEKFRAIFRWIANDINYDYKLYFKSLRKARKLKYKRKAYTKWKARMQKISYRHTLKRKRALCWGYSLLLENMTNHVGISCKMLSGYGRTIDQRIGSGSVNHAWNAVKLDGKWYLCDATWASCAYDLDLGDVIKRFDETYFLTIPSLFAANHFPSDTSWMLMYEKPKLQEFLNAPMKADGYLTSKVNQYFPHKGRLNVKQYKCLTFQFSINKKLEYGRPRLIVTDRKTGREERSVFLQNEVGLFTDQHFFESKGSKDVYIVIGDQILLYYHVTVL